MRTSKSRPLASFFLSLLLASCTPAGAGRPSAPVPEVPNELPPLVHHPKPEKNPEPLIEAPPEPAREFRGVWVSTVGNMDWPSRSGLSTAQQQAELRAILDRAVDLKLNAIVLQVRPSADAFYASSIEPWSEYLTGRMGQPPEPFYDPLAFAIQEAHSRGLELHAWFNPYRARYSSHRSVASADHISRTNPNLVVPYGSYQWMDPGEELVRRRTIEVIRDVVKRYDIDGVAIDDYFYPYLEQDRRGRNIDFPDADTWKRYVARGGTMTRADWRRENVNVLVQALYGAIKSEKSWVKFGVSPFGIWRPGYPEQVSGLDSYVEIFADSRKWLTNGWVDYWAPQLYWPVAAQRQGYPTLLKWWVEQNTFGRHIWPANYIGRVGTGARAWTTDEIIDQVRVTREQTGATGNIHFSSTALMRNSGGISDALRERLYATPALVPASPWLGDRKPGAPEVVLQRDGRTLSLEISPIGRENVVLWVVHTYDGRVWTTTIMPGTTRSIELTGDVHGSTRAVAISGVSRTGIEGPLTTTLLGTKQLGAR